jgi:hypothetical protein
MNMRGAPVKPITIIATAALMLLASSAHAQLLKCVSKDGRVEYATQCPAGSKEQATGIRSTTPAPVAPAGGAAAKKGSSLAEQDAEARKRQAARQEAEAKEAKDAAAQAQRQRACEDSQAYLKNLQSGNRVVRIDPKTGERVFLEDSQYASETAAAQKMVELNCK